MSSAKVHTVLSAILLIAFVSSCGDPAGPADEQAELSSSSPTLIECPTNSALTTKALIGPLGGTISLDGHSVVVPARAVLRPTEIALTVPASRYMEVDITANGQEHFAFAVPIVATISYARCTRADIRTVPLTVWYIDGETKALLEHMGGVDSKLTSTVTFTTDHLSVYAVAE